MTGRARRAPVYSAMATTSPLRVILSCCLLACFGCGSPSWDDYMEAGFDAHQGGRYAEAEELFLLASRQAATFDVADIRRATTLENLADVYRAQGREPDAEALYRTALERRVEILGPGHQRVAVGLENLATFYAQQGSYASAEPLYWRALEISEANLGPDHPDVATVLLGLARVRHSQLEYADAEPLYQQALAIREQVLGPNDMTVAELLEPYADLLRAMGRGVEATEMEARARSIRPDDFISTLNDLPGR
jgi:tetratricopeptide (TPR) repeat protein